MPGAFPKASPWEEARRHAREIVPAFSATLYFGWGARLARWISRGLYRVRLSENDLAAIDALRPRFPHDDAYLAASVRDFARWVAACTPPRQSR